MSEETQAQTNEQTNEQTQAQTPKEQAIELTFSTGRVVYVRVPKAPDTLKYMRALPALQKLQALVTAIQQNTEGLDVPMPSISDNTLDTVWPLFACVSGLTEAEVRDLAMWDALGIFQSLGMLTPQDFTKARKA